MAVPEALERVTVSPKLSQPPVILKFVSPDTKGFEVGLDNVTVAGASVSLIQFCVTEFEVLPAGSVCATL